LVHIFISQLAINLGDFKFIDTVLDVLFDAHDCGKMFLLREKD
jgi:hypothetical protein